ncbi:3-phosphoshikimate 1-carboxyvinyltransferase, partial [Candidatus Peregrinibacteria bacterium]|nr:3-phosphoshikimate 1-carboxyvinyltransferase [Candidatus Peregrinibacteria bacterium]
MKKPPIKKIQPLLDLKHFTIEVPGSKSYANRALIISALANGKSILKNMPFCDDTLVLIQALKNLGISIQQKNADLEIHGRGGDFDKPKKPLNLGNSGTAVRFLTAVLAGASFESCITGDSRMKERPIADLVDALNTLGADVQSTNGCPPIYVKGQKLRGGTTKIPGNISSQFISALLITAPYAKNDVTLEISTPLTSASYIDTTLDILKIFGIKTYRNASSFTIQAGQKYQPKTYEIPGDASSASYFLAIAAIHGAEIILKNMKWSSQGDFEFLKILKKMGGTLRHTDRTILFKGPKTLKALGKINMNDMPDSAMTAGIVAAFAKGKTLLTGLGNLKYKESDRLKALESELAKVGCQARSSDDSLEIIGNPSKLRGAMIESHRDHRIAMCFAVLGTK